MTKKKKPQADDFDDSEIVDDELFGDDLDDDDEQGAAAADDDDDDADQGDDDDKGTKTVPQASYMAEKSKRKAAETENSAMRRELDRINGKIETMQSQQPAGGDQEPPPEIDLGDLEGSIDARANWLADQREQAKQQRKHQTWLRVVADSIEEAKDEHEDFDEVYAHYCEMQKRDPSLLDIAKTKSDPATWAYKRAKRDMKANGDSEELERLRKENEDLRAGREPKQRPRKQKRMANARGGGSRAAPSQEPLTEQTAFSGVLGR